MSFPMHAFIHLIIQVWYLVTAPCLSPRVNVSNTEKGARRSLPVLRKGSTQQHIRALSWSETMVSKPSPLIRQTEILCEGQADGATCRGIPRLVWKLPQPCSRPATPSPLLALQQPGTAGSLSIRVPIVGEIESRGSFWSCLLTFFLA